MRIDYRGFTLIELILVMAIIMILSVIGFGSYTQATLKARDTQRKNDLNQIAKAIELFNNDIGSYPTSVGGVMYCPTLTEPKACGTQIYAYVKGVMAVYMDEVPSDPTSGKIYYYSQDAGGGFSLYAALENTQDKDVVTTLSGGVAVPTDWGIQCGSASEMCNYKITETGLVKTK